MDDKEGYLICDEKFEPGRKCKPNLSFQFTKMMNHMTHFHLFATVS